MSFNVRFLPLLLIFAFIGFFIWIFPMFSTGSLISIQGVPEQSQAYSFDGINGVAHSPYFGQISNLRVSSFCGNDGDVQISNSISGGNSLTLSSSIKTAKRDCGTNYVKTGFNLPPGLLSYNCVSSGFSSKCIVDGKTMVSGGDILSFDKSKKINVAVHSSGEEGVASSVSSQAHLTLDFTPSTSSISSSVQVELSLWDKFVNWFKSWWWF